ncbi:MAG: hypothetical protein KIT12_05880 [Trueperaceae bacterium]|nr:hypothetical protein [Trueperaceae bacterium]
MVTPHPVRTLRLLSTLALGVLMTAFAFAQGADQADLPVTRVVLFTNGVGYFEHEGTVTGNQVLNLEVPRSEMDDMLQSLVLQDFGGGAIRPVRYTARDPLERVLDGYRVDVSQNLTLEDVLAQARGEVVELVGGRTVKGTVVGTERVQAPEQAPRTFVTLATSSGVARVALDEFDEVRFEDEALKAQLDAALTALSTYAGEETATVSLAFEGEGERQVRIAYLREMPVWKSTYRLVLGDAGKATLQGWAIVDNPTNTRLDGVQMSFVAGQPISFITDLYEPIYLERPRVRTELAAGIAPGADSEVFMANEMADMSAARMYAMPAPAVAGAAAPQLGGAGVEAMATGTRGGATFSYDVSQPVTVGAYESAMVPIVLTDVSAEQLSIYSEATLAGNPLRAVRLTNDTGLHLAAGTVTLYDAGGFAGTAQMSDVIPGDARILSYAVDLELALAVERGQGEEQVTAIRLVNGMFESTVRTRSTTDVTIATRTDDARFLVVELPRVPGFDVVSPRPAPLMTDTSYRFGVSIDGGTNADLPTQLSCDDTSAACRLTVVFERTDLRRVGVSGTSPDTLLYYLQNAELSDADRAKLEQLSDLKGQYATLQREGDSLAARAAEIDSEQSRIRQNMAQLDRNSTLYRRYVDDLTAQEDELAASSERRAEVRAELAAMQERIDALIGSLGQ